MLLMDPPFSNYGLVATTLQVAIDIYRMQRSPDECKCSAGQAKIGMYMDDRLLVNSRATKTSAIELAERLRNTFDAATALSVREELAILFSMVSVQIAQEQSFELMYGIEDDQPSGPLHLDLGTRFDLMKEFLNWWPDRESITNNLQGFRASTLTLLSVFMAE